MQLEGVHVTVLREFAIQPEATTDIRAAPGARGPVGLVIVLRLIVQEVIGKTRGIERAVCGGITESQALGCQCVGLIAPTVVGQINAQALPACPAERSPDSQIIHFAQFALPTLRALPAIATVVTAQRQAPGEPG